MMRHLLSFFTLLCLSVSLMHAQTCIPGSKFISTQAQINDFATDYPGCTEIIGNLIINNGADIDNLAGLSQLTSIGGNLEISNNDLLEFLNGLENLTSVGGDLKIRLNDQLISLSGLNNLSTVGQECFIGYNPLISDLSGLDNLSAVGEDLIIRNHTSLSNLNGLDNLSSVGQDLQLLSNDGLLSLNGLEGLSDIGTDLIITVHPVLQNIQGLGNLTNVGRDARITSNPSLQNLNGLNNLSTIPEDLFIGFNDALTNLVGLENLTSVGQDLNLNANTSLNSLGALQNLTIVGRHFTIQDHPLLVNLLGLENLTSVIGGLTIRDNSALTSIQALQNLTDLQGDLGILGNSGLSTLNGLESLMVIGGNISVINNGGLTSLTGLHQITSVGGGLYIRENDLLPDLDPLIGLLAIGGPLYVNDNALLTSISGIQNIDPGTIGTFSTSFNDLEIYGNPQLSECAIQSICNFLMLPNMAIAIYGNDTGCNTVAEVMANCPDCPPGDIVLHSQSELNDFVMYYPNCTEIPGSLTLSGFYGPVNFAGLSQITSVGGRLRISSNIGLENLVGFDNLVSVGQDLIIYNNQTLTSLTGLENLISVGSDLGFYFNRWLTNLSGLDNLATVGGSLVCYTNRDLINFSGLESLTSVEKLSITYNQSLTSLTGLQNIDYTGISAVDWETSVSINNNPQLSECAIQPICNYLAIPDIYTEIYSNAVGCDSQGEVQIACFGCLPDGITITTQSQIDNFANDYPGCSTIPGDVIIQGGPNITNLLGLAQITTIEGSLGMYDNTNLANLNGLENLTTVGATLELSGNAMLTDLSGLDNVTSVGAELEIKNSNALLNLNGLNSLSTVGDYVRIYNNPVINSLMGLENLNSIGGDLQIWINNVLPSLNGLTNLNSIGKDISIEGNASLANLDGLENITALPGGIYLKTNPALNDLSGLENIAALGNYLYVESNSSLINLSGLGNVSSIGGYVWIYNNASLNNLNGLDNLNTVGGYLMLYDNPSLNSLSNLENLTSVGGYLAVFGNPWVSSLNGLNNLSMLGEDLFIFDNTTLLNLKGLENLTSIGGSVVVVNNTSLVSLDGIQNIDPATIQTTVSFREDIEINNNPQLSSCNVQSICDALALPGTTTNIHSNAAGCESRETIELTCTPLEVVCQNLTVPTDLDCLGMANAIDFDDGSTGALSLSFSVSPEGPYPLGTTHVILTVTDYNTSATCAATITVEDNIAPEIETPCPENIVLCGPQTVSWTPPSASDNCGILVTVITDEPGDFFEVGTTSIDYIFFDLAGNESTCSFDVTINALPEVDIMQSDLPAFCQGVKMLDASVTNPYQVALPINFSWSDGLGTDASVIVLETGAFSVTAADANGCIGSQMAMVDDDISTLLSAYNLIANQKLDMSNSSVFGGGVGVIDANQVTIGDNTNLTTFLRSEVVDIDGSSTVADWIDEPVNLSLPLFMVNNFNDQNNITVFPGSTMTLSGSHYGKITVKTGATLIFDAPDVYVNSLSTSNNASIDFTQACRVFLQKDLSLKNNNDINSTDQEVIFYVGGKVLVGASNVVAVDIYCQGDLKAKGNTSGLPTNMKGMFISNGKITSEDNIIWNLNSGCDAPGLGSGSLSISSNSVNALTQPIDFSAKENQEIQVFPNPTKDFLIVDLKAVPATSVLLVIRDINGQELFTRIIDPMEHSKLEINLESLSLPTGVYLLQVHLNNKIRTKRFVKE